MERQKIFDAFDNITLSEESANRMLDNILASASEISPTGKDGNMKKISRKPILIAAVIVVMLIAAKEQLQKSGRRLSFQTKRKVPVSSLIWNRS